MTTGIHRPYTARFLRCQCGQIANAKGEWCDDCEGELKQCDCCGQMRSDVEFVYYESVGDTYACGACRGDTPDPDRLLEEKRDRELDARVNRIYDREDD